MQIGSSELKNSRTAITQLRTLFEEEKDPVKHKTPDVEFEDFANEPDDAIEIDQDTRQMGNKFLNEVLPFALIEAVMKVLDIYNEIPFHNRMHAIDVIHMGCTLLAHSHLEVSPPVFNTFVLALAGHDAGHYGKTNAELNQPQERRATYPPPPAVVGFELKSLTDRAKAMIGLSAFKSQNEIRHLARVRDTLSGFPHLQIDAPLLDELILSTDITIPTKLRGNLGELFDLLHLADLGHFLRPWAVHQHWVQQLCAELRTTLDMSIQIDFIDQVVHPIALRVGIRDALDALRANRDEYLKRMIK